MSNQEDAFAEAGMNDMNPVMDFNQDFGGTMPQAKTDDYTEEEL